MSRECSGCGLRSCDGRCFTECAADYPADEETTSTLTLDELIEKYGFTEVQGDPFKRSAAR